MTGTEHLHTLVADNLLFITTREQDGLAIKAYNSGERPTDIAGDPYATPVVEVLARVSCQGDINLLFSDDPNGRRAPTKRAVEAATFLASTMGVVICEDAPDDPLTADGNVVVEMDTAARPYLEEMGFPFKDDTFKSYDDSAVLPSMPIGDVYLKHAGEFPAGFTKAHRSPAIEEIPLPVLV